MSKLLNFLNRDMYNMEDYEEEDIEEYEDDYTEDDDTYIEEDDYDGEAEDEAVIPISYRVVAIIGGSIMGLLIGIGVLLAIKPFLPTGVRFSFLEEKQIGKVNNFTSMVFPRLQQNLKQYIGLNIENSYNAYSYTTQAEQPLSEEGKLNFLANFNEALYKDEPDSKQLELKTYYKLLSNMYLNATIDDLYSYDSNLKGKIKVTSEDIKKISTTDLKIQGLGKLEDGGSLEVAVQIRYMINLFIQGYLGLNNLTYVTVEPFPTDEGLSAFTLSLNDQTKYLFTYSFNTEAKQINYTIIERVKEE